MKNEEESRDRSDKPSSSFSLRSSNFELRWSLLYTIVIAELALTILIFYLFTKAFD